MSSNFNNLNTAFNTVFGVAGSALTIFGIFVVNEDGKIRNWFWGAVAIYLGLFLIYILIYKPVRINLGLATKYEKLLQKLEITLRGSHKNKLPVTILCNDYSEYKQISFDLSKYASQTLIWTLYGSPIKVKNWSENSLLTDTDKEFAKFKSKNKTRFVVFESIDDLKEYEEFPSTSNEGRRRDRFKENIINNKGKLILSYKDGICHYLGCEKDEIDRCKKRQNNIDFEFGFVQPSSVKVNKILCIALIYLFNRSKYREAKFKNMQEVSFGFETGYKSGVDNSDKHINHVTFYPFGFELAKLRNNGYEENPNFKAKYNRLHL